MFVPDAGAVVNVTTMFVASVVYVNVFVMEEQTMKAYVGFEPKP